MIKFPTNIIDNFYNEPDKVREFALQQGYLNSPGNYPGKRTKELHELNKKLFQEFCEKLFSIYYDLNNLEWNVSTSFWKVSTIDNDPSSPKNMGWIHEDGCLFAGVVYLSPGLNKNLGTTIYKKIKNYDNINVSAMHKFYSKGIDEGFDEAIVNNNNRFEETTKICNQYNRLISFDGTVPHSPSHYYMENEVRINQVFFVHNIKHPSYSPLQRVRNIPA